MESKKMKRHSLAAWLAAAVMALTGCTVQSTLPQSVSPGEAQGATLAVGIDWGRQVQALREDVDGATVSIRVNGREPIIRTFGKTDWATESVDVSNLPGGDAMVRVEAYHGALKIGEGEKGVPLLIGRRTFANIYVQLDSRGRTDMRPNVPLGPMPDPNARVIIREVIFRTGGENLGHHEMIVENRTGHPIEDFSTFRVAYAQPGGGKMYSPILMGGINPSPSYRLDTAATVSVALDGAAPVWGNNTRTDFPAGYVQYQAGALSLVRQPMNQPEMLVDFVQWGQAFPMEEPRAIEKGLWSSGAFLQPIDPTGFPGVRFFAKIPGGRGVTNWDQQALEQLPSPPPGEPSPSPSGEPTPPPPGEPTPPPPGEPTPTPGP